MRKGARFHSFFSAGFFLSTTTMRLGFSLASSSTATSRMHTAMSRMCVVLMVNLLPEKRAHGENRTRCQNSFVWYLRSYFTQQKLSSDV